MINTGLQAGAESIRGSKPFQRLCFALTHKPLKRLAIPRVSIHRLKAGVNEKFRG